MKTSILAVDEARVVCASALGLRPAASPPAGRAAPRAFMFELVHLQDTVHIPPSEFGTPLLKAITDALAEKFSNKVLPGIGLCVTTYDILHIGESQLYPGNGSHHTAVEFRLVVFRPPILCPWSIILRFCYGRDFTYYHEKSCKFRILHYYKAYRVYEYYYFTYRFASRYRLYY